MPVYLKADCLGLIDGLLRRHTKGEVEFYAGLAREAGAESILELACGFGRVMMPLAQQGFSVTGIEASEEMIEIGKQKVAVLNRRTRRRIHFVKGDMRNFSLAPPQFKLIIIPYFSFWFNFSHDCHEIRDEIEKQEASSTLDCALKHLTDDGMFVIDSPLYHESLIADNSTKGRWWKQVLAKGDVTVETRGYSYQLQHQIYGETGFRTEHGHVAIIKKKKS
ncbi:MAG: class I SAM-dependent methyltransferase [bacterium]|nr:class I SAM-dependent methyltransferase [bacterium]